MTNIGPCIERVYAASGGPARVVILPAGVELIRHRARARPLYAIASELGICPAALARVMKRQPEARAAFEAGRRERQANGRPHAQA